MKQQKSIDQQPVNKIGKLKLNFWLENLPSSSNSAPAPEKKEVPETFSNS